ncbi:MAG: hypothetical protein V9G11_05285 [Bifidobacterium adolescentis]
MFKAIRQAITDDNELESEALRFLSLIFLLLSGIMSFGSYQADGRFWGSRPLTFSPGFISTVIAVLLVSPLYLRGVLKWNKSKYSILSFVLILLVFSSFVALAMGGNTVKGTVMQSLLVAAVLLSWLGIRAVAGVSWLLALMAAIFTAISNNIDLGFNGFIYIGSGVLGLILHSGLNPGRLVQEVKMEFSPNSTEMKNQVKTDVGSVIRP